MRQQEQLMKNGARNGAWLHFLESLSKAYRRTKERQVCRGCSWKALHVHRLAARYLNVFSSLLVLLTLLSAPRVRSELSIKLLEGRKCVACA